LGKTRAFFNEVSLNKAQVDLEFPNSRINPILLGGIAQLSNTPTLNSKPQVDPSTSPW